MRIAITGGRDHIPGAAEMRQFWELWRELGGRTLLHGDCRDREGRPAGVDCYVAEHVVGEGFAVEPFPVDVAVDGPWPGAGPRRNARMVEEADLLIAFHGGRGTADCKRKARAIGLPVHEVAPEWAG